MGKLMNKYQLLDNEFTFEFVQACEDVKKLGRIIEVLRSGELGHFPVLEEKAVQKLRGLDPENNHLPHEKLAPCLRQNVDLSEWEAEMREQEAIMLAISKAATENLPEIRQRSNEVPRVKTRRNDLNNAKVTKATKLSTKEYYEQWAEYDASSEILHMDLEQERRKEEENQAKLQQQKLENDILNSQLTMEEISNCAAGLPDETRGLLSEKARQKGNEHFNAQDFNLALVAYNTSIAYKPTCLAYNNRAMTHIKIGNFDAALADCNYVLTQEPDNKKALFRRSMCYKATQDWKNALRDIERLLLLEPDNKAAQADFKAVRKKLNIVDSPPKFKLEIQDFSNDELPLLFYGPSSSRFFYYPNNRLKMYGLQCLACRCNGTANMRNPLCRQCGDLMLLQCEKARVVRKNLDPILSARYVMNLCRQLRTNFIVHTKPSRKANAAMPNSGIKPGEEIRGTARLNHAHVSPAPQSIVNQTHPVSATRVPPQPPKTGNMNAAANSTGSSKPTTADVIGPRSPLNSARSIPTGKPIKSAEFEKTRSPEGGRHVRNNKRNTQTLLKEDLTRKKVLADDAKKRGDVLSASGLYPLSLRYYTTSINLFPQVATLLARATDHIRMRNFSEAVADCSSVLNKEPNNVLAYLRRATAYISMPPTADALKMAIDDFQKVLDLKPTDKDIQEDAAKLMELITERNQAPTPRIKLSGHRTNTPMRKEGGPQGAGDSVSNKNCKGIISKKEQMKNGTAIKSPDSAPFNVNSPPIGVTNGQRPRSPLVTNISVSRNPDGEGGEKLIYRVNDSFERSEKKPAATENVGTFKKKPLSNVAVSRNGAAFKSNSKIAGTVEDEAKTTTANETSASMGEQKNSVGNKEGKTKGKKGGCGQGNDPASAAPSSFQFISRWESQKKGDKNFKERASILRTVSPNQLNSVVGEKLDGDMLNEIVESLAVISLEDPKAAAEYLKCLPQLPRFAPVKLFMGPDETKRTKALIDDLEKMSVELEDDLKKALL